MANLSWDGDDFRNSKDSSGATADLVSHSGRLQQGYKHGSLTDGLVAYYPMEKGQGEVLHDGALDNLGQIKGATWSESEAHGSNSLSFDGSGDAVVTTLRSWTTGLHRGGALAFWINNLTEDGNATIINSIGDEDEFVKIDMAPRLGFSDGDTDNDKIGIDIRNGDVRGEQELVIQSKDTPLTDGELYFVVFNIKDGGVSNENVEIWINASEETTSSPGDRTSSGVGEMFMPASGVGIEPETSMELYDMRFYDKPLSKPEIEALYNLSKPSGTQVTEKQVPGQKQGGISRWKFNGDVTDSWGNNAGTNNGATFTTGVYGQAATFNGSSDNVAVDSLGGTELDITSSPMTFSLWTKISSTSNDGYVLDAAPSSSWGGWGIYHNDSNNDWRLVFDQSTRASSESGFTSSDKWYHLVGTWESDNSIKLYINGRLVDKGSVSSIDGIDLLYIGSRADESNYYNGSTDDIRIYNTALTPQQVEKLYHKGAYRISRESTLQ